MEMTKETTKFKTILLSLRTIFMVTEELFQWIQEP
jgi:hypothetical protein